MTTGTGPAHDSAEWLGDWEELRRGGEIQFEPVDLPEQPEPPGWLQRLFEWLGEAVEPVARAFGAAWPVAKWVLAALAVALLLYLLWRLLTPLLDLERKDPDTAEPEWTPERGEARALLEDADRLAAEGRYDEATHLLLQRSVGQIAAARPDWIGPSVTAREISAIPALPEPARLAFATIAERVERSLFALRRLGEPDWQAARSAYADFALAPLPAPSPATGAPA